MAKNRKTVYKTFNYLQCDDFAAYLSEMAAKGWHFKEWGMGLVFEKGEPEHTVYAVEVFFKGSNYDLCPSVDTLDFADYCEHAGWTLVEYKQKFCIFKQLRPDAVPIVTPEERLENAFKAYRSLENWQIALAVMWLVNCFIHYFPVTSFISSIFSNVTLILTAYWIFYALFTLERGIWARCWKRKARIRCANGESKLLNADESWRNRISITAVIVFTIGYGITAGLWTIVFVVGFVLAIYVFGLVLNKLRPDRETHIVIQVLFTIGFVIALIISAVSIISIENEKEVDWAEFPLRYADIGHDAGSVQGGNQVTNSSIFGSDNEYAVYYEGAVLRYRLYTTEHDWLMDIVWDHYMTYENNQTVTDCTALWDAETAFINIAGAYYVRYDDAILIFTNFDHLELTPEQVQIIREALELG